MLSHVLVCTRASSWHGLDTWHLKHRPCVECNNLCNWEQLCIPEHYRWSIKCFLFTLIWDQMEIHDVIWERCWPFLCMFGPFNNTPQWYPNCSVRKWFMICSRSPKQAQCSSECIWSLVIGSISKQMICWCLHDFPNFKRRLVWKINRIKLRRKLAFCFICFQHIMMLLLRTQLLMLQTNTLFKR